MSEPQFDGFDALCYHSFWGYLAHIQEERAIDQFHLQLQRLSRVAVIGSDLVEKLLRKAEPARGDKTNITQVQVLRHMLRMPEVIDDYNVYNDLQELLSERDEMEVSRNEDAAPAAYVDTERHPKPKSFYKAKKEREKKKG